MVKCFVWVNGFQGPEPQIWDDDAVRGPDGKVKPHIFKVELQPDELDMSLNELAKAYKDKKNG